ncbi:hypothetical protein OQA88_9903 [Cercophora sp. LCS_1]
MFDTSRRAFGLVALAFLGLSVPASAGVLRPRIDGEHVVLADCRDAAGVVSSQIAYFRGSPGPSPQDVAVVVTSPGQAALWVNTNTSALFTDTGVTFTSTLGPKVADGEYAGTGHNGYGGFSCWQKYQKNLYTYDGTTCHQVYACNHDPAPAVLPTPVEDTKSSSSGGGGLSSGALVAIVVGVVGGLVLLAAAALFWYWRRTRQSQQPPAYSPHDTSGGFCGLFGRKTPQPHHEYPPMPVPVQRAYTEASSPVSIPSSIAKPDAQEVAAHRRTELGAGHERVELDDNLIPEKLAASPSPTPAKP